MTGALTLLARRAGIAYRLAVGALPDRIAVRLRRPAQRFSLADVPAPVQAPPGDTRLYLAPANFAAQGYQWARAAERLPGVGAVNMQYRGPADYGFPADYSVSQAVFSASGDWARRQRDAVASGFTHVLFEAERPMFGIAFQGFVEREAEWLLRRGLRVGLASLGTDLRLPSRHAQIDRWSPFRAPDQDWIRALEAKARRNRAVFERLGVPSFVATPELLLDWPAAAWLPIVIDPTDWRNSRPALAGERPVVLHAPTNPAVKGTALIEPTVERLDADGIIDYQRVIKVPADQMPARYASADVVLDQFALGIYATTSIEAMAAGRLVVAHLHDQVRDHIREVTGLEPPVVEATPDTIGEVLRDVADRPEHYRRIAERGPAYVDAVHDGALSARVLAPFLGKEAVL
ncbi:glycosyltransferase [Agromyces sp. GXQ0307]|uniref:glycosyltransferase n=1 Tax=Agromyces sp. GXQ0307 TaxID=3377835 RepID=UPI00383A1752